MKILQVTTVFIALVIALSGGLAHAKADTVALYTEAVMTGDIPALETLLAPNYWHINANGHIEDKEHFINTIKNKELVIDRLTFTNALHCPDQRRQAHHRHRLPQGQGHARAARRPHAHYRGGHHQQGARTGSAVPGYTCDRHRRLQ